MNDLPVVRKVVVSVVQFYAEAEEEELVEPVEALVCQSVKQLTQEVEGAALDLDVLR